MTGTTQRDREEAPFSASYHLHPTNAESPFQRAVPLNRRGELLHRLQPSRGPAFRRGGPLAPRRRRRYNVPHAAPNLSRGWWRCAVIWRISGRSGGKAGLWRRSVLPNQRSRLRSSTKKPVIAGPRLLISASTTTSE